LNFIVIAEKMLHRLLNQNIKKEDYYSKTPGERSSLELIHEEGTIGGTGATLSPDVKPSKPEEAGKS
jgi:hypothetical protein